MKILFIHQNFPGQFKHLAPALAARGHEVSALAWGKGEEGGWQGVRVARYAAARGTSKEVHPWLADMETKVIRGGLSGGGTAAAGWRVRARCDRGAPGLG